jgi:hypothetical protein
MLTLFEKFYLLASGDEQGIAVLGKGKEIEYGLAGAVLSDLAVCGKVIGNDKHRLEAQNTDLTTDSILDQVFQEILGGEHPRKIDYWVDFIAKKPKKLHNQIANRLATEGVFKQDERHFLWVIPSPVYPDLQGPAKYGLKEHLRAFILLSGEGDLNDLALLSLLQASNLLKLVFTKDERKIVRQRIREFITREALANPAAQTIQEIGKAVATELVDAGG